jgi:hypothetical protein
MNEFIIFYPIQRKMADGGYVGERKTPSKKICRIGLMAEEEKRGKAVLSLSRLTDPILLFSSPSISSHSLNS